jgi:hypothetical protein
MLSAEEARQREQSKRTAHDEANLRDKVLAARASVVQLEGGGWFVPDGAGLGEGSWFDDYDCAVAIAERRVYERAEGRSGYGLSAGKRVLLEGSEAALKHGPQR